MLFGKQDQPGALISPPLHITQATHREVPPVLVIDQLDCAS